LITFAQAAFLEPLAAVVHGARVAGVAVGETVMVLGAGPIGLLFTMLLQQEGCYAVVVEPHKKRREMAARIGAPQVFADEPAALAAVRELTGGYGADLVVECTGVPAVWQASIDYVRRGGRVLLFGGAPPETQVSFDAGRLHYDQLQLIGAFHFTPADVARAVDLLTSEHFDPAPLITSSTSLAGLGTSLRLLSVGEGIKTLVHP
jgi:L-iditol 2-dehydrogenase